MATNKSFGEILRNLREKRELTLKEVSFQLNIDNSTLGKIEKNKRSGNKELIEKIAKIYDVSEKKLLISFLSDKVVYEIADEEFANEALRVAEQKVNYIKSQNLNDSN